MKGARILVVDDEPGMLRAVQRVLSSQHEVACSGSSLEALRLALEFRPELAILDIRMPDLDGFELLSRLKLDHPDLDVILMTGSLSDPDRKLIRAIRGEAFYFLQKPFDREVLTTLVERCVRLRRLAEGNRRHLARLVAELAEARAFQHGLLPPQEATVEGVAICCRYHPCSELGGDLFDYAPAGRGRAALLVADVSGHGTSAAMLTGVVKSAFDSARGDGYDPAAVAGRVWAALRSFGDQRFVTMFCAIVDSLEGRLEFVGAGHPPPLLWRVGQEPSTLSPTAPLISPALPRASWTKRTVPFDPSSRLLAYTDGITESQAEENPFGAERLAAAALSRPGGGAELVDDVLRAVREFMGARPASDDWTLLTARLA